MFFCQVYEVGTSSHLYFFFASNQSEGGSTVTVLALLAFQVKPVVSLESFDGLCRIDQTAGPLLGPAFSWSWKDACLERLSPPPPPPPAPAPGSAPQGAGVREPVDLMQGVRLGGGTALRRSPARSPKLVQRGRVFLCGGG